MLVAEPLEISIQELSKLPGIGRKSALRLSLFLLRQPEEMVVNLANSLTNLKTKLKFCSRCFNLATSELCPICKSESRDQSIICVVEEINDVFAIERTSEYKGIYHVLGGVLSPLEGIGPSNLKIEELVKRIEIEKPKEIILAMNPNTEGEATALFLLKLLQKYDVNITRIARGLPIGSDLEFADEATVTRALEGRISLK